MDHASMNRQKNLSVHFLLEGVAVAVAK